MESEYYPWGGDFTICSEKGCVAVVLLNIDYIPSNKVAIYGPLKTENIGIEKVIANVISNPYIRYLLICGNDIRGHRSGKSLISLHRNGIDNQHRIIDAPGAIPYIENLHEEAIKRFQDQIKIVDLLDVIESKVIDDEIDKCINSAPKSFGEPYIAIRIKPDIEVNLDDKRALHSKIILNYMGKIKKRGE
jgi:tetrahydromethanopterin S-methyltransferase subunit A